MAWEIVSAVEVAKLIGDAPENLRDDWYNFSVAYVEQWTGQHNLTESVSLAERINGTGTRIIQVNRPPIQGVSSVTIRDIGVVPAASYTHTGNYIMLVEDEFGMNPYSSYGEWPKGLQNIDVVYTSGSIQTNYLMGLAIALLVKQLADTSRGEGSQALIQAMKPHWSSAIEFPMGIEDRMHGIVSKLLKKKTRMR